ncbi:NUDIX hydrolase [Brevibacterium album]|uniref:NUDIX hydrolase n=1 Tax=Brevibacterium album TaxID=417948 RepID=UPI000413A9F8|nr:NUDIX domain-containing protein [Brevibacterium album]
MDSTRSLTQPAARPVARPHALLGHANVSERALASPELAVSTVVFALAEGAGGTAAPRAEGASSAGECTPPGKDPSRDEAPSPGEAPPPGEAPGAVSSAGDGPAPRLRLMLPLVRRIRDPFLGLWALPGGPLRMRESLEEAAGHHLRTLTGLEPSSIEQLQAFGGLDRSPGLRVVSIVYWAALPLAAAPAALARTQELENVAWFSADDLPALAFDHAEIIGFARERLRTGTTWGRLAHDVLGERFTLAQLREVGECIAGHQLDPGNFQRQAKADPHIVATEEFLTGGRHRPPRLYRSAVPEAGSPPR